MLWSEASNILTRRVPLRQLCQLSTEATSSVIVGGDKSLTFRTGHIARFADGAVVIESGDSAILATVVSRTRESSNAANDFLPLQVDYKQSAAAVGKIPTTYLRREMQQSDADIITSRIIDRSLRPMFLDGFAFDTHVSD